MSIEPHGGKLVSRFVSSDEKMTKMEQAKKLESIELDDIYLLIRLYCKRDFSPLEGFMVKRDSVFAGNNAYS
jgi:ATP sulfurylase